jgi:hypothetical protein
MLKDIFMTLLTIAGHVSAYFKNHYDIQILIIYVVEEMALSRIRLAQN